jgi:SagB-type dehydrogenase family enzyme
VRRELWQELLLPPGDEDQVWELFHENSKIGQYSRALSDQEVLERMREFHESLPFEGYPIIDLPRSLAPLQCPLVEAITARVSARDMAPCPLTLENLATLLRYGYGITRDNQGTTFPRPLRAVPSGGALYPLELFVHSAHLDGFQAGLYHYNPSRHQLRLLRQKDETSALAEALVQPEVAHGASLIVFITAVFERSIFKYGDRGYRFILLEAGHLAQNLNLVATGLGLGCLNIGGFFDRRVDDLLGLDGLTHATLYLVAVGQPMPAPANVDGRATSSCREE